MAHPVPPRLNVARAARAEGLPVPATPAGNRVLLQERRRQARRLKVAGLSAEAIALRLAADPEINSNGDAFPGGYGYQNYLAGKPVSAETIRKEAAADLKIMFERSRDSIDRDNDHMFDVALERIELVVSAAIGRATAGSQLHQGRIIEATDLQARMMGWHKSPVTVNVNNTLVVDATSKQPTWDAEYLSKFYEAMIETGAETPEMLEAAQASLNELLPVVNATPTDAVPVESTDPDE